jgi:hypothetical protein
MYITNPLNFDNEKFPNSFFAVRIIDQTTGRDIPIQDFGYLGKLTPGKYDIVLYIHSNALKSYSISTYTMNKAIQQKVWQIENNKVVKTQKACSLTDNQTTYENAFVMTVEVYAAKQDRATNWIDYPANGFRVLIANSTGAAEIYDTSIFCQNGKFWFSTGKKYSFNVSSDGNNRYLTHPDLNEARQWEKLRNFILIQTEGIESVTPNLPVKKIEIPKLEDRQVYIVWFNPTYGKGAGVINDNGTLRECSIHFTRIPKSTDPKQPQVVEEGKIYVTTGGVKIPDSNQSSFTWEITSMIRPINTAVTA